MSRVEIVVDHEKFKVITVLGPHGSGKSRTAVRLAMELAEKGHVHYQTPEMTIDDFVATVKELNLSEEFLHNIYFCRRPTPDPTDMRNGESAVFDFGSADIVNDMLIPFGLHLSTIVRTIQTQQ